MYGAAYAVYKKKYGLHGGPISTTKFGTGPRFAPTPGAAGPIPPGPGAYHDLPLSQRRGSRPFSAGPRYGFGSSNRFGYVTANDAVPGPGQYYDKKNPRMKPPQHKIGTSKRGDLYTGEKYTPGPGLYDPEEAFRYKKSSKGVKFSTDVRRPLTSAGYYPNTPGPGEYEYKNLETGPKYSMKGVQMVDPVHKEHMRVPSAAQYKHVDIDAVFKKSSKKEGALGFRDRTDITQKVDKQPPRIWGVETKPAFLGGPSED